MKYDNWTKAKKKAELERLKKKRARMVEQIDKDISLLEDSSLQANTIDWPYPYKVSTFTLPR